jgi:hypothetical protein
MSAPKLRPDYPSFWGKDGDPTVSDFTGLQTRCFWKVQATGNPWADMALGRAYAIEMVEYAQATGSMPHLLGILDHMPPRPEWTDVETSFVHSVGEMALYGIDGGRRLWAWWDEQRNKGLAEKASDRKARATATTNARWAKARTR